MLKFIFSLFSIVLTLSVTAQDRPNILWINCDDLGKELACYGDPDVQTPNMDKLALEGVKYLNAYANAPVCSASRSSQITGMYPSAINVLNHRTIEKQNLPNGIVPVMEIFRKEGYFCSNGWAHNMKRKGKEDYNFLGKDFFDGTDWKQRAKGQPFFAQVQIHEPHRTFVHDVVNPIDPNNVNVPSCYPDHPLIRADWAWYLESVQTADKYVGLVLDRLKKEGLLDNTIVILFGDHGRPHLRDKQWLYEGGLAIPLIVRYPKKFKPNTENRELISLVDITASSLALADIPIPEYMHGKNVLEGKKRKYVYGFRERCGDAVDDIRSISDGRYKLIWNRMPHIPYMQLTSYKKLQYPAFTLYNVMEKEGKLKAPYNLFMADKRPDFELYDLKNDPDEFVNLAGKSKFKKVQKRLSKALKEMLTKVETNVITESPEIIQKAKQGSYKYFKKGMEKKGLSANSTDEEILEYWNNLLLNLDN